MSTPGFLDHYCSAGGRRFLVRQTAALAVGAIGLVAVFGSSDIDRTVSQWFFDDVQGTFPLVNRWLLKTLLHDAARTASAIAALALFGVTVYAWLARAPGYLPARRGQLLFTSVSALTAAILVAMLKHSSNHSCPWDLADFGGAATYRPLLTTPFSLHAVGGCLPAAHPLTGFAWLSVGFVLYPRARTQALLAWSVAFTLGVICGAVQIMRGAHFVSHVLWSAWIVWCVNIAVLGACLPTMALTGERQRRTQC